MRQTENYKLNLLDGADKLSPKPLNENMEKVDGELAALAASYVSEVGARIMMASGRYTGNGATSKAVETPGFTPRALVVWVHNTTNWGVMSTDWYPSIKIWRGENFASGVRTQYNYSGGVMDATQTVNTEFTPRLGGLSWKLTMTPITGLVDSFTMPPLLAFNASGVTYEWVAFGTADVEDWSEVNG